MIKYFPLAVAIVTIGLIADSLWTPEAQAAAQELYGTATLASYSE